MRDVDVVVVVVVVVCNFRRKASVSEMLHDLGWQSLDGRRQDQRLVLFYKIINGLTSVETEDMLLLFAANVKGK